MTCIAAESTHHQFFIKGSVCSRSPYPAQPLMNMTTLEESRTTDSSRGQARQTGLLPITGAVFAAFLVIGMAMPVLPLHVHQGLGLGTFLVGLVAGSQFAAATLSRGGAGRQSDKRRPKNAVVAGLGSRPHCAAAICAPLHTAARQ